MDPFNGQGPERFATTSGDPAPPSMILLPKVPPTPKGFQVKVEDPDILYQAVQKGVSGELGRLLLESPLTAIIVKLESKDGEFNLVGELASDIQFSPVPEIERQGVAVVAGLCQAAAKKYQELFPQGSTAERGGQQVITTPDGRKIVLTQYNKGKKKGFYITTGLMYEPSKGSFTQIYPAPSATRESFDGTLRDFIEVLEVTLTETHKAVDRAVIDEELVLRGPKQSVAPEVGGFQPGFKSSEIVRRVLEEKVRQEGTTGQEPGLATTDDIFRELEGYEKVIATKKIMGFQSFKSA